MEGGSEGEERKGKGGRRREKQEGDDRKGNGSYYRAQNRRKSQILPFFKTRLPYTHPLHRSGPNMSCESAATV